MQKTLACYNGLKTDLGRSWADLGAILGPGGSFFEKKWLWLERRSFFQKKVAVARELGMGTHHSRATATFFLKNAPFSRHSPFFGDRRAGRACSTITGP